MGASLVLDALDAAHHVGLGDSPTRLLVRFAVSARDDDAEPWARLTMAERCAALGRDDDDAGRWAVKRATAALVRADLATLTEGGNRSGAARYSLTLAANEERSAHPIEPGKVGAQRSKGGRSALRKVGAQRTPKEDRGDTEEDARASAPPLTDPRCPRHVGVVHPPRCIGCRDARLAAEASAAAEAGAERACRAAALATLDPAAVEALSHRLGGLYSAEAITEAARAEMPGNLPLGLRVLSRRDDAAEAVARWER